MAGPTILLKPLKAPHFDTKGIREHLRKAVREEGADMKVLMQKTTTSWKRKPTFSKNMIMTKDQIGVNVTPDLSTSTGRVWMYLDGGTKIRWAVMSSPFKAKTRVGWLGSRRGRGHAVIWGKRAMRARNIKPRPGIKAREWSKEVRRLRVKKFQERMKKEFGLLAKDTIK